MELTVDIGTVFGSRYYSVELNNSNVLRWYHQTWNDMVRWCSETFGNIPETGMRTPGSRWYVFNTKIWFRNEEDLTLFLLKWQ